MTVKEVHVAKAQVAGQENLEDVRTGEAPLIARDHVEHDDLRIVRAR